MPVLDFFNSSAFDMISLTDAINKIPNQYGRARELNLFPGQGVSTRTIVVEEKNGVLNLLPTMPVGAPGTLGMQGKRVVRSFVIPHIPHDDAVPPEEVQGVRVFGSENAMEGVIAKVAEKLATMRGKHAITLEHLRMGALKGVILDADGSTLYNLYTEFNISPHSVDFDFATTTLDVSGLVLDVKDHIDENLLGETMSNVHVFCGPVWFRAFTAHANVKLAFQNFQNRQTLDGDYRRAFVFADVTFEQYLGKASDAAGTVRKFVEDDEAIAFPLGTQSTFKTYFAPADFNETVNTLGLELYAKQEPRKFGRGTDIHTQSNPLPLCKRPALLVTLTMNQT